MSVKLQVLLPDVFYPSEDLAGEWWVADAYRDAASHLHINRKSIAREITGGVDSLGAYTINERGEKV